MSATIALALAGCAAPLPPSPQAGGWPAGPSTATSRPAFAAAILAGHNRERAAVSTPPLAWDPQLAAGASAYARSLADLGRLIHSPRETRPGQGENLWMGTRGAFTVADMVGAWAGEKRWFRRGVFPDVSTTGRWSDIGHYSAMIWPTTTRAGCALGSNAQRDVLVCRYAPAGNVDGRAVP